MAEISTHALPDLTVLVGRDGLVMDYLGGGAVGALLPEAPMAGARLDSIWPEAAALAVKHAVRRCIAQRKPVETHFECSERRYELRAIAQGPDRALCIIRSHEPDAAAADSPSSDDAIRPQLDRRGFLSRLNDTLSRAAIQEKPVALALLYLDGLADIARVVDVKVSEQVLSAALLRLPGEARGNPSGEAEPAWYLGQLGPELLAVAIESPERDAIERCIAKVCASLRDPVPIGDAAFHLTPYAGVAVLGQDGSSPRSLLDKARSAAAEARRAGSTRIHFFTDTLNLRSLARLDAAREMREAIENLDIRLRYLGRHELASGNLVALVGYLRWSHPLRGELAPAEFLAMAESTGFATLLSRTLLRSLVDDFASLAVELPADARLSFGPLRHHLLHEDFVGDVAGILESGGLKAERLELRIAERTFTAMDLSVCDALHGLGIRLVIDEMGRGFGSLDRLARAPIWGLQLDRAWVTSLRSDPVALRVCRAGFGAAAALGLVPIATGVDDPATRHALLELGCRHGSGDLYAAEPRRFDTPIMRTPSQTCS
jgi:EAL domain-containing protein (putative c-di-GMP-specific phosphodiesterase class I)/GGDEF domain-containing protein